MRVLACLGARALIRAARLVSVFILRSFENAGLDLIIPGFPKIPSLYVKIDVAFKEFMAIGERVSACRVRSSWL